MDKYTEGNGLTDRFNRWFDRTFATKGIWSVADLKQKARLTVLTNFFSCLVVSLILGTITRWALGLISPGLFSGGTKLLNYIRNRSIPALILSLLAVLFFGPLEVGCRRFYLNNAGREQQLALGRPVNAPRVADLKTLFTDGYYWKRMGSMALRNLMVGAGFVCFLIPGIVLSYMYRLVPYLLAEQPGMSPLEAMKLSRTVMKGYKWDAFRLDLSFWPWILAGVLTFGLAGAVFGWPYYHATETQMYLVLIEKNFGGTVQ